MTALDVSSWSPPPAARKMRGDLLYIRVVTLESRVLHITACARGFFVNWFDTQHFWTCSYLFNLFIKFRAFLPYLLIWLDKGQIICHSKIYHILFIFTFYILNSLSHLLINYSIKSHLCLYLTQLLVMLISLIGLNTPKVCHLIPRLCIYSIFHLFKKFR